MGSRRAGLYIPVRGNYIRDGDDMTLEQKNRVFFAGLLLMGLIVSLAPAKANAPTIESQIEICPEVS